MSGLLGIFAFTGTATTREFVIVSAGAALIGFAIAVPLGDLVSAYMDAGSPHLAKLAGIFGALYFVAPPAVATANRLLRAQNAGPSARGLCVKIWLAASSLAAASLATGSAFAIGALKMAAVIFGIIATVGAFGMFLIFSSAVMVTTGIRPRSDGDALREQSK